MSAKIVATLREQGNDPRRYSKNPAADSRSTWELAAQPKAAGFKSNSAAGKDKSIRLRKKTLDPHQRKREQKLREAG